MSETICNCMNVDRETIVKAIKEKNLTTVEEVQEATTAGQAAGGFAVPQKLIQPRNKGDADGDALNVAEAGTERTQLVCPGRSVGVHKTVACIQGSGLELGRPDGFLMGGSEPSTNRRGLQ